MLRGLALLHVCLLLVAVAREGNGCTIDAAGHDACPEYQDDRAALLQSQISVVPSEVEPDDSIEFEGEEDAEDDGESADAHDEFTEDEMKIEEHVANLLLEVANQGNQSYVAKQPTVSLTQAEMKLHNAMKEVIDIDKMVKDQETEAAMNYLALKQKVQDLIPEVNSAKATFKAARGAIRANFKKCKKKITFNKKTWKNKKECKPFKDHFFLTQIGNAEELIEGVSRVSMKPSVKACSKRPKCELRQAKRKAKKAAKTAYKKELKTFRDYRKQRNKALFQMTILPKIITLLKPTLLDAMTQIDMSGSAESGMLTSCVIASGYTTDCVPLGDITTVDVLRNYMSIQLASVLSTLLKKVFKPIKKKIWQIVKPVKDSISASLTTAVGSIPVVGGALSTVVGMLVSALYYAIQSGVNGKLDEVKDLLQDTVVTTVVTAIFATGIFTTESLQAKDAQLASKMKDVTDSVSKNTVNNAQSTMASESSAAEAQAKKAAKGQLNSITSNANQVKQKEDADDAAEVNEEEAEEKADIDDDDED